MSMRRSLTTLERITWSGFRNFGRNAWLSVAATAVMTVSLTIMLAGFALNLIMKDTINEYSEQFTVSIYLRDDASEIRTNELKAELQSQDFISKVNLISKEEALKRFQERYKDNPEILDGFNVAGGNALPASFDIVLKDVQRSADVEPIAMGKEFDKDVVSSVSVGKKSKNTKEAERTIQVVANAKKMVGRGSIITSLVFALIAILIIFNTIRMAIYTRAEEIRIMKLIGATPGYIRGPFLVESSMYGIVAAIISFVAVTAVLVSVSHSQGIVDQIAVENTIQLYKDNWILIFLAISGVGIMIGLFSSLLAMEKHLKLKRW